MRPRRDPAQQDVTLITAAAPSLDDQHDARRRKYLILMGTRAVCLVLAVVTATISLWFAAIFIVGGVVLPWCAVLIANDRPARSKARSPTVTTTPPERGTTPTSSAPVANRCAAPDASSTTRNEV